MKLKKFAIVTALALITVPVLAQNFEGTTPDDRIGYSNNNNEDSIKVGRQNISLFQQSMDIKDYKEARINLLWLKKNAPYAINGIYTQGPLMYYFLISDPNETDKAKKLQYFNEMMEIFDMRLKNLDALNSFSKIKNTKGDVLSVKAEYYNWTAPKVEGSGYTLNKSYANFAEAIKMVNEQGGREITGTFLQTFFAVSDAMYKAAPNALREQYLQDYLDSKDACETMLMMAKEAQQNGDTARARKLLETYDMPLAAIEQQFSQSGAADSTQLAAIYTKKYDTYKDDLNKLNSSLVIMQQNNLDETEIYYRYADAAYTLQPTFISAIGLAQKSQKEGDLGKMLEYYNKALELCSTDARRGAICLNICNGLTKSKQYIGALKYAEMAISYNPDYTGKAYMKMANINALLGQFNDALKYCDKASEADITVSGSASRLKEQIRKAQANQEANDKAQKEYNDFLKRKKAEEDFWSGGGKK